MIVALLNLISRILCVMPESLMVAVANTAGAIWWHVLRYRRKTILANIARAFPERTIEEQKQLGRQVTTHLVRTLLEFFRIPALAHANMVRFEGLEHIFNARKEGKGVFCLSGHLGSFELCVAAVSETIAPVALVVKAFPNAVDAFINRVRRDYGVEVIGAKGAIKPIFRALKKDALVVFVLDQNATRSIGVFVDFFGEQASTMSALATLVARTQAPVVWASPYRNADGTHVLKVHPAIPWEERETHDATIVHMTQRYSRMIEDAIRAHPEQWFWTHKRWRTRPPTGN